jgi:hypothetical protein
MMADVDRLVGKWRIVETDMWPRDHLDLCGPAFRQIDTTDQGDMAFGALDCGFTPTASTSNGTAPTKATMSLRRLG